jgi:hypothetical protein
MQPGKAPASSVAAFQPFDNPNCEVCEEVGLCSLIAQFLCGNQSS